MLETSRLTVFGVKDLLYKELEELLLDATLVDAVLTHEFDFERLLQVSQSSRYLGQVIVMNKRRGDDWREKRIFT